MNMITFGKRKQRSILQESLNTSVRIAESDFRELLLDKNNKYKFYSFDKRCNQILFIGNPELEYMWLYIQIDTPSIDIDSQENNAINFEKLVLTKNVDIKDLKAYFNTPSGLEQYNKHQYIWVVSL